MTPTKAELAAHRRRMAERRAAGQAFLDRVAAEKGRPLCLACDTTSGTVLRCEVHDPQEDDGR